MAAALILALVAVANARQWSDQRQQLVDSLASAGLLDAYPDLRGRVEREAVSHQARLITARAAVYRVLSLQQAPVAGQAPNSSNLTTESLAELLAEARRLSASALVEQPNSWQAAMLLGASTYLDFSLHRDRRLYTEAWRWERPLTQAMEQAPARPEPRRILATAYLECWHALSPAKRELAQGLLKRVFDDDLRAFEALSPAWFALDLPRDQSLAVVPDDPDAWHGLKRVFADRYRWSAYVVAHQRWLDAVEQKLVRQRSEAAERLRLGDLVRGRELLLRVIQEAPPSQRFLPLVTGALDLYPPGLHGLASTSHLVEWLDWALELDRLGLESLPPRAADRLLDAVAELEPPTAARVALLADDRYQAERYEKVGGPLTLAAWTPYLIAKAGWLLDQRGRSSGLDSSGLVAEADDALSLIPARARDSLPFRLMQLRQAEAEGDSAAAGSARQALDADAKTSWTALDWRSFSAARRLDLLPRRSASGLELEIVDADRRGSVIEVMLDGRSLGVYPVLPGQRLRLEAELDRRPHVLQFRALAGGGVSVNETLLLEQ